MKGAIALILRNLVGLLLQILLYAAIVLIGYYLVKIGDKIYHKLFSSKDEGGR
jgi:uncharacterized membrane protein|tara:strand:+ start:741 stop:899 length:159 start_codon:yes stop_codon:yes gene_type:complete